LRADRLAVLPDGVDTQAAAALPLAGLTALRTLERGGPLLGARVLVTAAAGGVGWTQVRLAVAAGAEVVAVTRRRHLHDELLDAGASSVVAYAGDAAGLFDLVLDGVGGTHLSTSIARSAPGGHLVLHGASDPGRSEVNLLDFVGHEDVTVHTPFSYASTRSTGTDLARLVRLLELDPTLVRVGDRRSWHDVDGLLQALADGEVDGKAVLTIGGDPS
ncbi:zinc-binding dehydrogenase, partial [Nocardioides sp.]|uniref:zinc-binding dehydrogenase n=1 Tax=Nocardioides sp. TaxID=35761 RepID=UPI00271CE64D